MAGYTLDNWQQLEHDLRNQILPIEATLVDTTPFGQMYEIRANLIGPNGVVLTARTFWMIEAETGQTKFITMYPERSE